MANWTTGNAYAVKHFNLMNLPRKTVYRVISKCQKGPEQTWKFGSGRNVVKIPTYEVNVLKKYMREKMGRSQARAAPKFKITQQHVSKILLCKTSLKESRRESASGATEAQKEEQNEICRKLRMSDLRIRPIRPHKTSVSTHQEVLGFAEGISLRGWLTGKQRAGTAVTDRQETEGGSGRGVPEADGAFQDERSPCV